MKIKLEQLVSSFGALERLGSLYLTGTLNFRNGRTLEDARPLVKNYCAKEIEMIAHYGGVISPDGRMLSFSNADAKRAFEAEKAETLNDDVEIYGTNYELDVARFDLSGLSGADMLALKWLVTFKEEEQEKTAAASGD